MAGPEAGPTKDFECGPDAEGLDMEARQRNWLMSGTVALVVQLVLAAILAGPVPAAQVDAALFYHELASQGRWVNYGHYGPVWHPTGVAAKWRPYLDGRWVPTSEGWVFETPEPWGWATYHFGNWMPTAKFGWVWVPGSTWYPSTVAWRAGDDFIGWAPLPPPGFVPPPAFAPTGGFIPGTPALKLLTPPFWIFAQAPNFLLGFGKPFAPAYSFSSCGCLAPWRSLPTIFPRTFLLTNFFFPRFAPRAFFAFGPPFSSVAVFGSLNLHRLNKFAETVNFRALRNVMPPAAVFTHHPFIRTIIPAPVLAGQRFQMRRAPDIRLAERFLAHPGVMPPPQHVPPLNPAILRGLKRFPGEQQRQVVEVIRGSHVVRGLELPAQAELQRRVLRPKFPRRRPGRALVGIAPGRLEGRRGAIGREGEARLTPQEEFLRRRLEFELLRRQFRRFPRGRIPAQMGPGFGRGLGPVLLPITPGPGAPRRGRAIIGVR
jgi:hypothetical protein